MTVSDPGAGQQQGREGHGVRSESMAEVDARIASDEQQLAQAAAIMADQYAPSPTPPARWGREGCTCGDDTGLSSCVPGCPCRSCRVLTDSGRDEAREAVARWLQKYTAHVAPGWCSDPEVARTDADDLLALPELDKLLRRPA